MKLLKNLSWIFFANAFVSLAKWLIVIVIAKNLTPVDVGLYSLAFAIGAPITLFANMKLRSLYITSERNNINEYFYVRNILSLIALLVLIGIGLFVYPQYLLIIILVGLTKILDLQSDLYYSIPHKNNDLDIIGKLMIAKQVLVLTSFSLVLILTKSLFYALISQLVIQLPFLFFIERSYIRRSYEIDGNKVSKKGIKSILILGLPLGIVQMLFSVNTNYPRYILEYFENAEVLGYFAAIMYIVTVFNLFMNSISQVFLPKLSNLFISKNIVKFKEYLYIYLMSFTLLMAILLIVTSVLFGEWILTLLYGIEYAEYANTLILISISVGINMLSWNFDTALMSMRYISIQPKITVINLIITAVFGYILIMNSGITGAAYTLIISSITLLLMRGYFVTRRLKSN